MPIFNIDGKEYNVQDEKIKLLQQKHPDATTVMEDKNGKKYRVKSVDYYNFVARNEAPSFADSNDPLKTVRSIGRWSSDVAERRSQRAAQAKAQDAVMSSNPTEVYNSMQGHKQQSTQAKATTTEAQPATAPQSEADVNNKTTLDDIRSVANRFARSGRAYMPKSVIKPSNIEDTFSGYTDKATKSATDKTPRAGERAASPLSNILNAAKGDDIFKPVSIDIEYRNQEDGSAVYYPRYERDAKGNKIYTDNITGEQYREDDPRIKAFLSDNKGKLSKNKNEARIDNSLLADADNLVADLKNKKGKSIYDERFNQAEQEAKRNFKKAEEQNSQRYLDPDNYGLDKYITMQVSHLRAYDLKKMSDDAWNSIPVSTRNEMTDKIYKRLKREYPNVDDFWARGYAEQTLRMANDKAIYKKAKEANAPKSELEMFLRSVVNSNILGSLTQGALRVQAGTIGDMAAREEAEQEYINKNGSKATEIAGTVVGMASDPSMALGGALGKAAVYGASRIMPKAMAFAYNAISKGANRAVGAAVGEAASRKLSSTLTGRLTQRAIGGGVNFATFEGLGEAANQYKWGGYRDPNTGEIGDYNVGEMFGRAGHGLIMGGVTGIAGELIGNVGNKLVRSTNSTAGKAALRTTEFGVAALTEGTIFAIPQLYETDKSYKLHIEQLSNSESQYYIADPVERQKEIDRLNKERSNAKMDVWTDNMAMIGGFKAQGLVMSAKKRIAQLRKQPNSSISFNERLRSALDGNDGLALTRDEKRELRAKGYGNIVTLTTDYLTEQEIKKKQEEKNKSNTNVDELPYTTFSKLMEDNDVSETTRAKIYYYITGNTLPLSTITNYSITEHKDKKGRSKYTVTTFSQRNSVVTKRTFSSKDLAEQEAQKAARVVELNFVDVGEKYYNFLNESGTKETASDILQEEIKSRTGIDIDDALSTMPQKRTDLETRVIGEYVNKLYETIDKGYQNEQTGEQDVKQIEQQTQPEEQQEQTETNPSIHTDGNYHLAKLKRRGNGEEQEVYVTYGNIVTREDGTIDAEKSDESVTVYNPSTGKKEIISPTKSAYDFEVGETLTSDEYNTRRKEQEAAEEEVVEPTEEDVNETNNVTPADMPNIIEPGMEFIIKDENGEDKRVLVTSRGREDDNGEFVVGDDGDMIEYSDGSIAERVPETEFRTKSRFVNREETVNENEPDIETATEETKDIAVGNVSDDMPMIGDGEPDYKSATPQRTARYLYDETDISEAVADGIVKANYDKADKNLKKTEKKLSDLDKNPGTSIAKYKAERTKLENELKDAKEEVEYWSSVSEEHRIVTEQKIANAHDWGQYEGKEYVYKGWNVRFDKVERDEEGNAVVVRVTATNDKGETVYDKFYPYDFIKLMEQGEFKKPELTEEQKRLQQEEMKQSLDKANAEVNAEIEKQRRIADEQRKQREENANKVGTEIRDKWNNAAKIEGRSDEIVLPNGESVSGRFILHESGDVTASHNSTTWDKSKGFPEDENGNTVNDRDYKADDDARKETERIAEKFDQRALQSPVVVSRDGVVLSGNGRTIAGEIAARNGTDADYLDYLARFADKFGFTEEQVRSMKNPRVSFLIDKDMPYNAETFAKFNQQEMKSQSKTEQSVKLGKTVRDETFRRVVDRMRGFDTLAEFYNNPEAALGAIMDLHKDGVISRVQLAEMVDGVEGNEKLSDIGRNMLETMLVGKVFDNNPEVVRILAEMPQMRKKIVGAMSEIADNIALGDKWSLQSQLAEAVEFVYKTVKGSKIKEGESVSIYAGQLKLFTKDGELPTMGDIHNKAMLLLADAINDSRVTLLRKVFALYNSDARDSAAGQIDLFDGRVRTVEDILNDVINYINNGKKKEIEQREADAVAKRKGAGSETSLPAEEGDGKSGQGGDVNIDSGEFTPAQGEVRQQKGSGIGNVSSREAALRDVVVDRLKKSGVDVVTDVEEGQRLLDEANGEELSQSKKRALETVSVTSNEAHQPTVVSSAEGAKVLKELDNTKKKYEYVTNRINTFIGDVANALGAKRHNSRSEYATFETKNGKVVTIRLSDHNAKVSNFDNRGELDGISIVVSPKKSAGVTNDGDAHVVEYYYDAIKLRKADGKPLADIVRSIKQALYSGEFEDTTGLAERQEVNGRELMKLGGVKMQKKPMAAEEQKHKETQLSIINDTNPAPDDYHTWVRSIDDILTLQEAVDAVLAEDPEYELSTYPDVSDDIIREALRTGRITIYSSKPIKNGVFVTPSMMQAMDYSGGTKVFSKEVPIRDVAWINTDEGQYTATSGEATSKDKEVRFFRTPDGHAYGFVKDGKIFIDPRIANAETPIHEYAHLWAEAMRHNNPKEWENIVRLMRATGIWDEVVKRYPELKSDSEIADEVLSHYSGRRGAERLREEMRKVSEGNGSVSEKAAALSALERVREALKRFWKGVADWFGIHFTTAEEVADKVLSDLLNGVNPNDFIGKRKASDKARMEEDAEMADIVARAKADGTYMKAPNGKPSKLSPRQWAQVRTKAFKEWFGDWENDPENSSKVVDENGEPRVVYHGSGDTFTIFSPQSEWHGNFFSSERSVAESYSPTADNVIFEEKKRPFVDVKFKDGRIERQYYDLGGIYNVYLDIKKPLVVDSKGKNWNDIHFKGIKTTTDHISDYALKQGCDGVIFINLIDGAHRGLEASNTFVAFNPNQIKSATDNIGTFDGNNPDIRYQFVGERGAAAMDKAEETEDVAREDQIFLEDGLGMSSSERVDVSENVSEKSLEKVNERFNDGRSDKAEDKRKAVDILAKRYGLNIRVVEKGNEITDADENVQKRKRGSNGWYDKRTGEVTVVLGNNESVEDVVATVSHEVIAHKGLRELVGEERYGEFLDETYQHLRADLKKGVDDAAGRSFMRDMTNDAERAKSYEQHRRDAVDELFGRLAEKPFDEFSEGERTLWQKLKTTVRRLLDKFLGSLKLPKWFELGDNELRYILWRSKERLERGTIDEARDKSKREELGLSGDSDVLFREVNTDMETEDIWKDRTLGLQERMTAAAVRLSDNHKDSKQAKLNAMRAIGGNLSDLRRAMSAQREYDRTTVKRVVDLAKVLIKGKYLNSLSNMEVRKLLNVVGGSVGKQDIKNSVDAIMDIMINNQLKNAEQTLHKLLSTKAKKTNSSGVSVMGSLDIAGQQKLETIKNYMYEKPETIEEAMADLEEDLVSDNETLRHSVQNKYDALELAMLFSRSIAESIRDENALKDELKNAKENTPKDDRRTDSFRQYIQSLEDVLKENRTTRLVDYAQFISKLNDIVSASKDSAKEQRRLSRQRKQEIYRDVYADLGDRDMSEFAKQPTKMARLWNSVENFFAEPTKTLEVFFKMFGDKHPEGKGNLYNRFVYAWNKARDTEIIGSREAFDALNKKAKELFGKDKWGKLFDEFSIKPMMNIQIYDNGRKRMRTVSLTAGNMMYVYMVNKMSDGKMKLRKMGISEEDVSRIARNLDPRLIDLADWVQDVFLPRQRDKYNATHERLFGAPMDRVDNYFPLVINKKSLTTKEEELDNPERSSGISTVTGAIKRRTVNSMPIDILNADALKVLSDHVIEMEHFNAFAEYNRDINTLRTFKPFQNAVRHMGRVDGKGETLLRSFNSACQIATGSYTPRTDGAVGAFALNIAKGVTSSKIAFRTYTALKQLTSYPAYVLESNTKELIAATANPYKSFVWCMDNLPIINERWKSRIAGDPRLMSTDIDWGVFRSKIFEFCQKWGMAPNAFIDSLTVCIGAKAIYETKYKKYIDRGYDNETASEKAKSDAVIFVNSTQQSTEGMFLSTVQVDRTVQSVMISTFRNASFGYTRQVLVSARNINNMKKHGKAKMIDFMTDQYMREGFDRERARENARKDYKNKVSNNIGNMVLFGCVLPGIWAGAGYGVYMLCGDNEEEKKKMLKDALVHTVFGFIEGVTYGDVISTGIAQAITGSFNTKYLEKDLPVVSDLYNIIEKFSKGKNIEAVSDVIALAFSMGLGTDPKVLGNFVNTFIDACGGDPDLVHETSIFVSRLINAPKSQIDMLYFDELGFENADVSNYTPIELAERYARYKVRNNHILSFWGWDDEQELGKKKDYATKKIKEQSTKYGRESVLNDYSEYESIYKSVSSKLYKYRKSKDKDEREALYNEIIKNKDDLKIYTYFKSQNVLDRIVDMYFNSTNSDQANLCAKTIAEYKEAFVDFIEADDADKKELGKECLRIYGDFMKRYNSLNEQ